MEIFDLRTEGMREPLGIGVAQPLFSWKIKQGFQSRYRILVSSSREALLSGNADVWDSGPVRSGSTAVRYGGAALAPRSKYFWCVQNDFGTSEPSAFETAFLGDPMPQSCWIGMPLAYQGGTDLVRLDFSPQKKVRRARLYLAGLGCCRCYLNGDLLSDGYFDGAVSVYSRRVFYRTFALPVREGNNALCVELGYGFYGAKKLCAEVYLEYEDGSHCIIPSLAGRVWNVTGGNVSENSIYGGEVYDARGGRQKYLPEHPVGTDEFVAAYSIDPPAGKLCACPIPPMRVVESFSPARIGQKRGVMLVDAGKNVCGWLRIRVRGKRGAKVTVRYAELLDGEGRLGRANLRTARSRDVYILSGEGEEVYAPSFTYHGFRYAEIAVEGEAEMTAAEVQRIRSDVQACGSFTCSDAQLNALHGMAVLTEANNLNGIFTDCPQRDERLGWLNDMSARIFEAVCNFDLRTFLPNFVNMITDGQRPSGAIGDTAPFSVGSAVGDAVDAYPLLGWVACHMYGDMRVLEENYAGFCRWNECLSSYCREGVCEWGIYGDWCPAYAFSKGGDGTHSAMVTPQFMAGAYYIWNLSLTEKIAAAIGKEEDSRLWAQRREQAKGAFFKKYVSEEGSIGGNSQTECAVGITVFPEEKALCERWARAAVEDIRNRGYHTTCGNQGYRHLFYRLAEYGYAEDLVRLLKNEEYPGWGYMLRRGATTVWERWEADVGTDMHSFNHPMFAAYDGFLYNYLAGIRTEECRGGFEKIVIEPCFVSSLSFVSASLDTVRGTVSVGWERKGEEIVLRVTVPGNTNLTVRAQGRTLRCRGLEGKNMLRLGNGEFQIEIGEYDEKTQETDDYDDVPAYDGEPRRWLYAGK